MDRFIIDGRYKDILNQFNISVERVLKKAKLSEDILNPRTVTMAELADYNFIQAIGDLAPTASLAVDIAIMDQIEMFSPPIFAAYCSKNGNVCLNRLAQYKKLIGPMQMNIIRENDCESVLYKTSQEGLPLPAFLVEIEFAFLISLLRRATQLPIRPLSMTMTVLPKSDALEKYAEIAPQEGDENCITFSIDDLEEPFISHNEAMWDYFVPELNKRLADLDVDESMSARVRSVLTELLPSGTIAIDDVADMLGITKRTLQRKLAAENTTFQKQLNNTREILALHYIKHTDMNVNDIAYLLGYMETNSFLRAFTVWTGMSFKEYKKKL